MKFVLLGVSFAAGFVAAVLLLGIYQIEGVATERAPVAYKINRLTGEMFVCVHDECRPVRNRAAR